MKLRLRHFDIFSFIGLACIGLGLAANARVWQALFVPDGRIESPVLRALIIALQLGCLALGVFFLRRDRRRLKRDCFRLLTFGGALIFSLAILEIGLRLQDRRRAARDNVAVFRVNDSGAGSFRLIPNMEIVRAVGEAQIRIHTNAFGMNWRDVEQAPTPGRPRIAVLGDSFSFGLFARDAAHGMIGVFDERVGDRYEALNFGVPGYAPGDLVLQLEEEVPVFRPDFLVVQLFCGNDFIDNYLGLDRNRIVDGVLELDYDNIDRRVPPAYRPAVEYRRRGHRTYTVGQQGGRLPSLMIVQKVGELFAAHRSASDSSPAVEWHSDNAFIHNFWSQKELPTFATEAVAGVLRDLDRLDTLRRRLSLPLLLVIVPYRDQVEYVTEPDPRFDPTLPQRYLTEWAAAHNVPCLDLLPELRRIARQSAEPLYLRHDPHFTEAGHAAAGRTLAEFFLSINPPREP